ncbi:S-layer homology domain-containing protein [Paenibacillus radicis (ex Xue et al. 2023)]|uniref:S-layer homology domain-containing protein n=1 Tax=Paenibacillus radicis (ex Xue et al. 2023) TaxID=2972489 RepID=A0ABT1YQV3_9BACL|nr:S-layer homology domain-containing protein [Paenibacillus radicis (ex Xue et al. 2023)]MCR8635557.1 S-layer homology domain-containing protein [Paenibacillus radicis (ex Xue et al. 2023)]
MGRSRNVRFRTIQIILVFTLIMGSVWLPASPSAADAVSGTPGGVDAGALRLWLKADPENVTLNATSNVTVWRDSSPNGNHFVNDGSIAAISSRPKPKYQPANSGLNFQPSVGFSRSSSGSILQDINGLFGVGKSISQTSVFAVTGGVPSIDNSMIFNQELATGSLVAHIPYTNAATPGVGSVLWDSGALTSGTGTPRMTVTNQVNPSKYNLWGLHFDASPMTVGTDVYQSVTRDGKSEGQSKQARLPFVGKANGAMSLGAAAGGGSGYNGNIGEFILFTDRLTATQKRQVETYLAIKFGIGLQEGDYLSAGSSPQVVWNAAANADYRSSIAGIGKDLLGALDQQQSRSADIPTDQVVISAKQPLLDKQYLLWGDNGSTGSLPYGAEYKRLTRSWKAQNTGNVGAVQIAIPKSVIPLGGVLLTSSGSSFGNEAAYPLSLKTIQGVEYYAADVTLENGSYFTFAEKLPLVLLNSFEVWDGATPVSLNEAFAPSKTKGYEAIVSQDTGSVRVEAAATSGAVTSMTLSNYITGNIPVPILDPGHISLVPGVNKLKVNLSSGSADNSYQIDIIRKLSKGEKGKIGLNAGSVTASSYQPNTNYIPANVVDGVWGEDTASQDSRWSASGQGQWLQFDLGQSEKATYLDIAFLNARDRSSSFEILGSNDPEFTTSTILLPKRNSRSLKATDSVMQSYVLTNPSNARYLRLVGYGNSASGSSGNWNSIMEVGVYTGTAPIIEEPKDPSGPPEAGENPEVPTPELTKVKVSSAEQLQNALDQAVQGTNIELQNGNYEQNGPFVVKDKTGTVALPIRITAAEKGKAVITGNSYMHIENSQYIEVSGLVFRNGIGTAEENADRTLKDRGLEGSIMKEVHPGLELRSSSNVSILRNTFALDETGQPFRFDSASGKVWCLTAVEGSCRYGTGDTYSSGGAVYMGDTPHTNSTLMTDNGTNRHYIRVEGVSSHNRIAYNDIGPKKGFGAVVIYDGEAGKNVSEYDLIEYNYFHDIGPRVSNGLEAIRLGLSGLSLASGHVTIQNNLFDGLNAEDEIISVKSSDNIIRYNTIRNSYGGIVARHGHRNSFYGNFIIGDGKKAGMGGFRIYGNEHKIYNNYMEGLTDKVIELDGGTHDGGPDGGSSPTVKWGGSGTSEQTVSLGSLAIDNPLRVEILRGHWRQYNVQVYNNTIVNVGNKAAAFSFGGRNYQPVATQVYNNVVFSNAGTVFNEISAAQNVQASERAVYAGNLVEGTANLTNITRNINGGFEKKELKLVRSADGMIRLSAQSPAIDASKAPYITLDDMDGQIRYNTPDAGADEYMPGVAPTRRALTVTDVGPNAGQSPPVQEGDPGLSSLVLRSDSELVPGFSTNEAYYTVAIQSNVSSLTIVPKALNGTGSQITVSVDGKNRQTVISGQESQALEIAQDGSIIVIEVANPSGKNKVYTIVVHRQKVVPPSEIQLDKIQFDSAAYRMKVDETKATALSVVFQDHTESLTGASVYTTNPAVATVDERGVLRGKTLGETVVVATYKGHFATAAVSVYTDVIVGGGRHGGSSSAAAPSTQAPTASPESTATTPVSPSASTPDPAPTSQSPSLTDVKSHWAGDVIAKAIERGIVAGYPDGSFKPEEPITRLQFAAMLVRALKLKAKEQAAVFADQSEIPEWASREISAATQAGIIQGYEDHTLRPNRPINRAEMVTMLLRAFQQNVGTSNAAAFSDGNEIPQWSLPFISQAMALGVVQGRENNRFEPSHLATRAEAVIVLIRMIER